MKRLLCVLVLLWPVSVRAADDYALCEQAIAETEKAARLPSRLFGAIARAESGRADEAGRVRPWPWTINLEGAGVFFPTKAEAVAAVMILQAGRPRSVDVGCMQVSLLHHPRAFATLEEAFDPATNAAYAAGFLGGLYRTMRDWPLAVAAYHSQNAEKGEAYQKLVYGRVMTPQVARAVPPTALTPPPTATFGAFLPREALFGAFRGK